MKKQKRLSRSFVNLSFKNKDYKIEVEGINHYEFIILTIKSILKSLCNNKKVSDFTAYIKKNIKVGEE